jgi:hypothetical protein
MGPVVEAVPGDVKEHEGCERDTRQEPEGFHPARRAFLRVVGWLERRWGAHG